MTSNAGNDNMLVRDVEGTVEVIDTQRAPALIFSYLGLDEPKRLWHELETIGWTIPKRPPPPEPTIDWESTIAGIRTPSYRVVDFRLEPPRWDHADIVEKSLETINLLHRLGVEMHIPIAYLDFLRRTRMSLAKGSPQSTQTRPTPTLMPATLLLSRQPWPVLANEDSLSMYEGAVPDSEPAWYWSESQRQLDAIGTSREVRSVLLESADCGWELMSRTHAPACPPGERVLRFVMREVQEGSEMLDALQDLVGDRCASALMCPIRPTGTADDCLFVIAIVPSEQFSQIGHKMITAFPNAIGRGKRFVLGAMTGETAA